jgi:hypothetical protein
VYSDPVFSPTDASEIAFRKNLHPATDVADDLDLVIAHLEDFTITDQRVLTNPGANEEDPTFSPDGSQVLFTRTAAGRSTLFRVATPTATIPVADPVAVPVPPGFPTMAKVPAWSPR